jgi:hypothetical protein
MVPRFSALLMVLGAMGVASAQPKGGAPAGVPAGAPVNLPPLVGASETMKVTAPWGFVEDLAAFDSNRLAYAVADGSTRAELRVVALGCADCQQKKQEIVVDLAAVTLHPIAAQIVGQRALVIGTGEDGNQVAAMFELMPTAKSKTAGALVYKLGPATHISLITRDGKQRIAVHRATPTKDGTRHEVEIVAIETGKRVAAGRPLELGPKDTNKQLDFKVNHWSDGMTHAIGLKGGEWDKKENQRSPDVEATYDLISGKMIDTHKIDDLFEQRKRYQLLADAGGKTDFLRMAWDNSAVQIWRNGKATPVQLDQSIQSYDPKSLQGMVNGDGSAWIVLKVDPVNPEAVARKKADPEYLDVFKASSDGKAVRKARVLATGQRHHFGVVGDRFWLLERSASFDRGGRTLTVYQL